MHSGSEIERLELKIAEERRHIKRLSYLVNAIAVILAAFVIASVI